MAFYDYECEKCGSRFTVKQSFAQHDQSPKPKCTHCRSPKVHQLFTSLHVKTSKKS